MPGAVIAVGGPGVGESGSAPGEEKQIMWAADAHVGPVARAKREGTRSREATCLRSILFV